MSDIQTSIASFAHRNIPTCDQEANEWDISLPSRSGSRAIKPSQRGEQSQTANPAAQRSPVAAANGIFSRCDESLRSLSFAKTRPPTSTQQHDFARKIAPESYGQSNNPCTTHHQRTSRSTMQSAISRHQPPRPFLPWKSICKNVANKATHPSVPNTVGGFNNRCRRLANIQQPPCPLLEPVVSRPSRSWPGVMRSPQAPSRPPPACPCPSILAGFSLCLLTRACLAAQPFSSQESGTCISALCSMASYELRVCTLPHLAVA